MRRKSDRTASKKSKPSPEKKEKVEKAKHTKRSRKQSSSSASESTEDPQPAVETAEIAETKASEPPKSGKEDSSKESPDQVWQVKSAETSGDVGEIKKLKLCLARPPSTPERLDRSPRSKRKHSRATSSSDTQSVEGEDKKKSKRRSRRCTESKDVEKNDETQEEETEIVMKDVSASKPSESEPDQSVNQSTSSTDETPMSITHEEIKCDAENSKSAKVEEKNTDTAALEDAEASKNTDASKDIEASKETGTSKDSEASKLSGASKLSEASKASEASKDTETSKDTDTSKDTEASKSNNSLQNNDSSKDTDASKDNDASRDNDASKDTEAAKDTDASKDTGTSKDNKVQDKTSDCEAVTTFLKSDIATEQKNNVFLPSGESPLRKRSLSAEKSEILELHAEESRCVSSEVSFSESQDAKSKTSLDQDKEVSSFVPSEVSINKSTTEISGHQRSYTEDKITSNKMEVANNINIEKLSTTPPPGSTLDDAVKVSDSAIAAQNITEESQTITDIPNGEIAPLVVNRKRRWGSRPSKLSTQKSITISTDVLKEIIPDVKPAEFDEVIEEKKHKRIGVPENIDRPVLPKIVIDNTDNMESYKKEKKIEEKGKENEKVKDTNLAMTRKISIVKEQDSIITRPPSPPRHKQSSILYITNLVRPFTLPQLKNLLQRTGRIVDNGFWIDRIKSKCYVKYETEDQAVETRHALHGVTWPVSNPKTLLVDFSTQEDFDKAKANEDTDNAQASTIPGTVEDWLREQDMKREKGELEKPWERKAAMREWDVGKNEKSKEVSRPDKNHRDERPPEKRRHRTIERSPEPARKFKKKEEEAPAKLLDDLFRKTKATPCIYWLPLSAETIAVKEEQRRQHMAEHERRLQLQEQRRPHRRH